MLEAVAHYNNLSDQLRADLEKRIAGFGDKVRFKFHIEKPNPDKTKYDGEWVWPSIYVLDPAVFDIVDPNDKKRKKIGIVREQDEKGIPTSFKKIQVKAGERGIKFFDLNNPDDRDFVALLLLHPKLKDGIFEDKNRIPMVSLIDEVKEAKEKTEARSAKLKAMMAAAEMKDDEIRAFADAMVWDSTLEVAVLKGQVEDMAEFEPVEFLKQVEDKKGLEYKATVKKAMDRQIIGFNPAEYTFVWVGNNQVIASIQPVEGKSEVELFATVLSAGGEKMDALYKKIKTSLK